ncbi:MAG: hypothetical protein Fur0043_18300 [Anaerolineales bacterium]
MEVPAAWQKISTHTAQSLRSVAYSVASQELAKLSLPELDAVVDLIARVIPAGNVPGMILSGLARLPDKTPSPQQVRQDIRALFKGVDQLMQRAVYGAFFAGPAAVLWGYQNLLKLAGKDPASAFPEGTWQFYVDYALREDTARHTNETHGFDTVLGQHGIRLKKVDRVTAWVMTAMTCLHQYNALLANEWYERVALVLLEAAARGGAVNLQAARLYREWEKVRPYRREAEASFLTYPAYRCAKFEQFLEQASASLPKSAREAWRATLQEKMATELPAYQRQMSILAYLEPGPYGETRTPYPLKQAQIGIILHGAYFLLPACQPGSLAMADVYQVRAQVAALFDLPSPAPGQLSTLATVRRADLSTIRKSLNRKLTQELDRLRFAPILLNCDQRSRDLPLAAIRQTERGVGDHALTIFDTGETIVFDQSHIFFDGAWGAALAEILTNEALSWANYLSRLPPPKVAERPAFTQLSLLLLSSDQRLLRRVRHVPPEAAAETSAINLKACQSLRKLFKQRSDLLQLTINDLLVLYRAIHALLYQPSPSLQARLENLEKRHPDLSAMVQQALQDARTPRLYILMPLDASRHTPRDRLYPVNVEIPLDKLPLLDLHRQTLQALQAYETAPKEQRAAAYARFDHLQRNYLSLLAGLSHYLAKLKQIALQGESAGAGAIRLLAHLPPALQRLLDELPQRIDLLNHLLKGQEIFSNLGRVAPHSSLTRFITAKDDNDQKQLAWGILTDDKDVLRLTLRDFRPYVAALHAAGQTDISHHITQDYLDGYAAGLNVYIQELRRITYASRETQQTLAKQKRPA